MIIDVVKAVRGDDGSIADVERAEIDDDVLSVWDMIVLETKSKIEAVT